jgi:RNA polymerase sigma factor (sigma-70 family)
MVDLVADRRDRTGLTILGEAKTVPVSGDDRELARVFEENRLKLLGMVQRYLGGRLTARIDAEEVLQDAFVRARARWIVQRPEPAHWVCWVYGQVRDTVIEQIRKELGPTRSLDKELPLPEGSIAEIVLGLARSQTGPATQAGRSEWRNLVHQALSRLKFRDFEVIDLHIFADLTFVQISDVLGEPEDTLARRYRRALIKLMALLPDFNASSPRKPDS